MDIIILYSLYHKSYFIQFILDNNTKHCYNILSNIIFILYNICQYNNNFHLCTIYLQYKCISYLIFMNIYCHQQFNILFLDINLYLITNISKLLINHLVDKQLIMYKYFYLISHHDTKHMVYHYLIHMMKHIISYHN